MNLKKIYNNITLKEINSLSRFEKDVKKMLILRNYKKISDNMYNNSLIKKPEHKKWFMNLLNDPARKVFFIYYIKNYVGSIILNNISPRDKRSDWAYYMSPKRSLYLGFLVEFKFIDFFFKSKKMNKLNCEVLDFNKNIIKLHKKFGFEIEGVKKEHIFRSGRYFNSILMGLNKKTWHMKRKILLSKFLLK